MRFPGRGRGGGPVLILITGATTGLGREAARRLIDQGLDGRRPRRADRRRRALPDLRANGVDPGYTATAPDGNSGPQTVPQGTDATVATATIGADGPTGTSSDRHGPVGR